MRARPPPKIPLQFGIPLNLQISVWYWTRSTKRFRTSAWGFCTSWWG